MASGGIWLSVFLSIYVASCCTHNNPRRRHPFGMMYMATSYKSLIPYINSKEEDMG